MAISAKAIKTRIKSVKNTKKITKAMQMVAAAKMRKAVEAASRSKEYAVLASNLLEQLKQGENVSHPLLESNKAIESSEENKALVIVISSNRGLCGSFNTNVLNQFRKLLTEKAEYEIDGFDIDVLAIGKKGAGFAKKMETEVIALYEKLTDKPKYEDIVPISNTVVSEFLAEKYSKVFIVYTNFISSLKQEAQIKQILPVSGSSLEEFIAESGRDAENQEEDSTQKSTTEKVEYKFEPSTNEVLDYIVPKLLEMQVYQAVLESTASEHSARMLAMKNATDAAGDLIDSLLLAFNKARQAAITTEIAEIVSGAEALS